MTIELFLDLSLASSFILDSKSPAAVVANPGLLGTESPMAGASFPPVYLLLLVIMVLVPVGSTVTPPGHEKIQCFTCMDKEPCSNLSVIYGKNDMKLYERDGQEFPKCSAISSPPPGKCSVCDVPSNISIICSGEVGKLEVESSGGDQISDISSGCSFKFPEEHQQLPSSAGLITSNFFLIVLGVLTQFF